MRDGKTTCMLSAHCHMAANKRLATNLFMTNSSFAFIHPGDYKVTMLLACFITEYMSNLRSP